MACEVQSDISKKSVEKYATSPTPEIKVPTPVEIDPADVVSVDIAEPGPQISISKKGDNGSVDCSKFNRFVLNGNDRNITVKGACKQIMVNGDKNNITATAVSDIVVNGSDNQITYSKYINGKLPIISDNGNGNEITISAGQAGKKVMPE